jgi:hypothetical protein
LPNDFLAIGLESLFFSTLILFDFFAAPFATVALLDSGGVFFWMLFLGLVAGDTFFSSTSFLFNFFLPAPFAGVVLLELDGDCFWMLFLGLETGVVTVELLVSASWVVEETDFFFFFFFFLFFLAPSAAVEVDSSGSSVSLIVT